jgi:hypothetical protein
MTVTSLWRPRLRCGAASPFGLALPSAQPTASQLYAPRGVWFDDDHLIVADSGNHRVLIWHGLPTGDGEDAHVVLGQPDFSSEGADAGGRSTTHGLHLPTGVLVHDGRLLVADAWHHRVLVWDQIPTRSYTPPSYAIGQQTLGDVAPNGGGAISAQALYWPYGIGLSGDLFWIADTGNRRVLGWHGVPGPGVPAEIVLGQDSMTCGDENRGGAPTASSFRWPHAIAGDANSLLVADAGNHRILGWTPVPTQDTDASLLLGQRDFSRNEELPHRPQGAHRLRFPYALAQDGDQLAVADTANNRVLIWDGVPREGIQRPADHVLGQLNFDAAGENRWKSVEDDSLCWPYGIWMHNGRLAIADSGNNRMMLWEFPCWRSPETGTYAGETLTVEPEHVPGSSR